MASTSGHLACTLRGCGSSAARSPFLVGGRQLESLAVALGTQHRGAGLSICCQSRLRTAATAHRDEGVPLIFGQVLNSSSVHSRRSSTTGIAAGAAVQERSFLPKSENGVAFLPQQGAAELVEALEVAREDDTFLMTGKLIDNGMVYREKFVIRCYEVGVNRTASLESIANLLQEIGCNHAQSVGFSNDGFATTPLMRKKRLIWVTTRMHIEMDRYPVWGDVVEIDTWFQGEGSIVSRRDWVIRMAKTGETIGRGTSTWVTMNQDTRRLSKIPEDVREEYMKHCPEPARFALPGEKPVKIPKLEDPAESVCSYLRPRRGDLDMNQHVNNVTYIGWMLESVPASVLEVAELAKITLEYRREVSGSDIVESLSTKECLAESTPAASQVSSHTEGAHQGPSTNGAITSQSHSDPSSTGRQQYIHLLRVQDDNTKEINRGRTVWRPKNFCSIT